MPKPAVKPPGATLPAATGMSAAAPSGIRPPVPATPAPAASGDALAAIPAERILLTFGSGSPHRGSATQHRIMQTLPNVRSAEIPGAGHPPRLLTPYEWILLVDFLLEP